METSNEKIIDRIRKLLTLAQHPNTSVEEAATAAARAQELLFKHKLDAAQIEIETGEQDDEKIGVVDFDGTGQNAVKWKDTVLHTLARAFFCEAIIWCGAKNEAGAKVSRVKVIGKPSDTTTVAYLYQYVCAEIERLCDEQAEQSSKSYRNSFKVGASHAVYWTLDKQTRKQKEQEQSSETALVLVRGDAELNEYIKTNMGKLTSQSNARPSNGDAFRAGREAGESINVNGGGKGLNGRQRSLG